MSNSRCDGAIQLCNGERAQSNQKPYHPTLAAVLQIIVEQIASLYSLSAFWILTTVF